MAEYMNKEVFLSSMGLIGDETKYGNRDAERQSRSYSTYMSYEIMDSVEDSIVEEELDVKHGRWIKESDGGTRCSVCNKRVRVVTGGWDEPVDLSDMPYCPKCGARMNEEAQNER